MRLLLDGQSADVKAAVDRWLDDFAVHRVPVRLFARTETLQDSLEVYRDRVRERAAPSGSRLRGGPRVGAHACFPAIRSPTTWPDAGSNPAVAESAKLASAWNPDRPGREHRLLSRRRCSRSGRGFATFTEFEGLRPYVEPTPGRDERQLDLFAP